MENWILEALGSAENSIVHDADVVTRNALPCDRWIASSALQKAIRRGDTHIAQRAALVLHREDRARAWRRLIAIAFEDIGPADSDLVVRTVAAAVSSAWRAEHGEERVFASFVSRLAEAPKDRSADYLMWAASEHPSLVDICQICAHASIADRLSIVGDISLPLAHRAIAAWFSSGIDYPHQRRVGPGDLQELGRTYAKLGADEQLATATVLAAKRTRQPYTVLLPLVWLEVQRAGPVTFRDDPVPASAIVAGVPLYALDEHTRQGKRAINTLAQDNLSIRARLEQFVPKRRWIAAAQHAAFYAEGSAVSRRMDWAQSRSLEMLGIEAELSTAEVRPEGVLPLIQTIRAALDQLNAIRTRLLESTNILVPERWPSLIEHGPKTRSL
jgi:MgsA AAA+ ATPase C terminal